MIAQAEMAKFSTATSATCVETWFQNFGTHASGSHDNSTRMFLNNYPAGWQLWTYTPQAFRADAPYSRTQLHTWGAFSVNGS